MTSPYPLQGWLVVLSWGLSTKNLSTKFKVSNFTHYEDTKTT